MSAAVSTRIAVQAGLLLVSARVDLHPVKALFDPAVPTSLAPDLAARIGAGEGGAVAGRHVIGLDHHELPLRAVRVTPAAVPLTIGSDLIANDPVAIDLPRGRLHLMEPRDLPRATKGMVPLPARVTAAGCLEATAALADGRPVPVAIGGTGGEPVPVRLGPLPLAAARPAAATCSPGALTLGWASLAKTRIVIDRPHDTLWVAAK